MLEQTERRACDVRLLARFPLVASHRDLRAFVLLRCSSTVLLLRTTTTTTIYYYYYYYYCFNNYYYY